MIIALLLLGFIIACLVIPFIVASSKRRFAPAVVSTPINCFLLLFLLFSSLDIVGEVVICLLMGLTTAWAVFFTVTLPAKKDRPAPKKKDTLSLSAGEAVVLSRVCLHIVPLILLVHGVLASIVGLGFALDRDEDVAVPLIVIGLAAVAIAYFLDKLLAITLTVTNKRVIVNSAFNSRKSLPINRISAVGTAIFSTLYVGSSAGRIILPFVPGCADVYDTINALLSKVE